MNELNISLWGFLTFVCYYLIAGFFTRVIAAQWPNSTAAKALLFIH